MLSTQAAPAQLCVPWLLQYDAANMNGKASPSHWCWLWHPSPLRLTLSRPPGSACACWAGCHLRASWRPHPWPHWTAQAVQVALACPSWWSCCCGQCKRCALNSAEQQLPRAIRATAMGHAAAASGEPDRLNRARPKRKGWLHRGKPGFRPAEWPPRIVQSEPNTRACTQAPALLGGF